MAKKDKRGLGEPAIRGADALFDVSQKLVPDEPETEQGKAKKGKGENKKTGKTKTSLYIGDETLHALQYLRFSSKGREGRIVPIGEYVDRAVEDLVKKMDVSIP